MLERERLEAVGERLRGCVVDLDQQTVEAGRGRGQAHRPDQFGTSRGVRRIDEDREGGVLPGPDGAGEVERVACLVLEGPDAALAEDDRLVAAARTTYSAASSHSLQLRRESALQEDRRARLAQLVQQVGVVHVARADLERVDVRRRAAAICSGAVISTMKGRPVSRRTSSRRGSAAAPRPWKLRGSVRILKTPPRSAAAPCDPHVARDGQQLLARLDGARAGDDDEALAADAGAAHLHRPGCGRRVRLGRLRDHPTHNSSGSAGCLSNAWRPAGRGGHRLEI